MNSSSLIATVLLISTGSATMADYPAVVIADSPLAYYRFEESPGATTISDSSGNGRNADNSAPAGTTLLGEPGAVGSAVLFNGGGSILTPLNLNPSAGDFTIEAIINPTIVPGDAGIIVSNQNGTGVGRSNLFVHSTSNIRTYLGGAPTDGATFEAETWHHVIMTYDQSGIGGAGPTVRFYVNGVEGGTGQPTAEAATGGWVLGSHKLRDRQFYTGLLDEVAIYDKRLDDPDGDGDPSDSRVAAHYDAYLEATLGKPPVLNLSVSTAGQDLIFEWESTPGATYNLSSTADLSADVATWDLVQGDIAATPPTNTLALPRPGDNTRFYRMVKFPPPPVTVFSENFDSGPSLPGGWLNGANAPGDTGTTIWEVGNPGAGSPTGPPAARSAPNCAGTNIGSDYGLNTDIWLRTPGTIDLTTATEATLTFQQFRDIETGFDLGSIRILRATDDTQLGVDLLNPVDGSGGWEEVSVALPPEAVGEVVKVEFRFQADEIQAQAGWYIDDVAVTTSGP